MISELSRLASQKLAGARRRAQHNIAVFGELLTLVARAKQEGSLSFAVPNSSAESLRAYEMKVNTSDFLTTLALDREVIANARASADFTLKSLNSAIDRCTAEIAGLKKAIQQSATERDNRLHQVAEKLQRFKTECATKKEKASIILKCVWGGTVVLGILLAIVFAIVRYNSTINPPPVGGAAFGIILLSTVIAIFHSIYVSLESWNAKGDAGSESRAVQADWRTKDASANRDLHSRQSYVELLQRLKQVVEPKMVEICSNLQVTRHSSPTSGTGAVNAHSFFDTTR